MERREPTAHSFIVKVWSEEPAEGTVIWRGRITHVPSGRATYITHLGELARFITPYLYQMGVRASLTYRIREQFRRWWLLF